MPCEDYLRYFDRVERGQRGRFKTLCSKHVVIIGAGAIGSTIAYWLSRAGVGELTIIDGDVVEEHNLERTECFTPNDVGKFKVNALKECIERSSPWTHVNAIPYFLRSMINACDNNDKKACSLIDNAFSRVDLVIVGVDNDIARWDATQLCIKYRKPYLEAAFARMGFDIGAVYYFPKPWDGPCRLCTFAKGDFARMNEPLGYNLLVTCPSCGRMFRIINWKFEKIVKVGIFEGNEYKVLTSNNAEYIVENGKVVGVKVPCPYCGYVHTYTTPDTPVPTSSEMVKLVTAHAYYWALRILLGQEPNWNFLRITPDGVEQLLIKPSDGHYSLLHYGELVGL